MKKKHLLFSAIALVAMSLNASAQTAGYWGMSTTDTWTPGPVGIGTTSTPADATLLVNNSVSGTTSIGPGNNPGLKINHVLPLVSTMGGVLPNHMEIWDLHLGMSGGGGGMTYIPNLMDVIDPNGWLGIKRAIPRAPLDVNGDGIISNSLAVLSNISVGTSIPAATPDAMLDIYNPVSGSGTGPGNTPALKISRDIPAVFSGLPTFPNHLEIWDRTFTGMSMGGGMGSGFTNTLVDVVDPNGWLGILQPNPTQPLDVNGNALIEKDLQVNGMIVSNTAVISMGNTSALGDGIIGNNLYVGAVPNATDPYMLTYGSAGGKITKRPVPVSTADNLGNHTATMNLNMASHSIINAGSITGTALSVGVGSVSCGTANCASLSTAGAINGGSLTISGFGTILGAVSTGAFSSTGTGTFASSVTAGGVVLTSDRRFKKNIAKLDNIKDAVFKLIPSQYTHIKEASDKFKFDDSLHFGFIAQEVQKVFPNIVRPVDSQGHLGIMYTEIIPLLLEALKEEDAIVKESTAKIEALENKVAEIETKLNQSATANGTSGLNDGGDKAVKSTLAQNIPNPFSKETSIGFNIVGSYNRAFIGIYDLNGKELKKVEIQPNSAQVTIPSDTLIPGMYIYSLLVDNNLIDSKRMVVQ